MRGQRAAQCQLPIWQSSPAHPPWGWCSWSGRRRAGPGRSRVPVPGCSTGLSSCPRTLGPSGSTTGAAVKKASVSCCRKRPLVSSPSASCPLLESSQPCHGGDRCKVPALFPWPPHSCCYRRKCQSEREALWLTGDGAEGWACPSSRLGRGHERVLGDLEGCQ